MKAEMEQAVEKALGSIITPDLLIGGMFTTVIILAAVLGLRFFLIRLVRGKREILDKDQRRWINRINNSATILVLLCLVFIWAPQLHTFALSLTAFAAAVALATKELLMCLTGGFLRAAAKPFDIGDWITVDGQTGEVMRVTAMTTFVEQIDMAGKTYQFTGHTIQIPNSKFLSFNVENANFTKNHVYYDVPITVQYADLDPAALMAELGKITEGYFAPLRETAIKFNRRVERKAAVDFADPEPQFFLKTTDIGHNVFTVRIFVPAQKAAQIAAGITCDFLSHVHHEKGQKAQAKSA